MVGSLPPPTTNTHPTSFSSSDLNRLTFRVRLRVRYVRASQWRDEAALRMTMTRVIRFLNEW